MTRRIIPCTVTDEYVRGDGVPVGAAGSHNDVVLRLAFSPLWAGTARSIVWKDALGENATVTLLGTNLLEDGESEVYLVPIPAEPKAVAGELSMTIKGVTVDGAKEKTATLSAVAHFTVLESDWDGDAEESGDVNATQAAQLQAELAGVYGKATEALSVANQAKESSKAAKETAEAAESTVEKLEKKIENGLLPTGGAKGQVLQKASDADGDYEWGSGMPTSEEMLALMLEGGLIDPATDGTNIYTDADGSVLLL